MVTGSPKQEASRMTPVSTPLIERLRKLHDKASRGVSYGFEQAIWSEAADALTQAAERIAELEREIEVFEAKFDNLFNRLSDVLKAADDGKRRAALSDIGAKP